MANRLANETSQYLLQHKDNPVDWYPWGEAAFERAKAEDKPVFLSVGYSACHWCHVMEHESFEDDETAALLNEYFVSIKVDREERPDVDGIYMQAVQALTGHGGWPMSVWLLPDGRPFYGGTYFPRVPRHGMPSFQQVLRRIAEIYTEKRDRIENDASRLTSAISGRIILDNEANKALDPEVLTMAYQQITQQYDAEWGGFGTTPKFPPAMTIELLLRLHHRHSWSQPLEMVRNTLDRMLCGGMYDQIGGGFHRYSVDRYWLVPHFEKMLYDNALLIKAYLFGYQVTGEDRYRRAVEETIQYVQREMTAPSGAFYSSQDADSEGEEGRFFVWTADEVRDALGNTGHPDLVLEYWGMLDGPNFEGTSILWVPESAGTIAERHDVSEHVLLDEIDVARQKLFEIREQRIKPATDEKILTSWNSLMINGLAQAGRALDRADYIDMATKAAHYILTNMRQVDGRLYRTSRNDQARLSGYLEDYAFFIEALFELYQSTFDSVWFEAARDITDWMLSLFWDDESGFFDTAHDHESLITRPQEVTDNAIPSGTSGAVAALARMSALTGNSDWQSRAERVLMRLSGAIQQYPQAFSYLASQLDFITSEPREIALVSESNDAALDEMLQVLFRSSYRPNQVVALKLSNVDSNGNLIPLLSDRSGIDGKPTAYVCQNFICQLPVSDPEALAKQLDSPQKS